MITMISKRWIEGVPGCPSGLAVHRFLWMILFLFSHLVSAQNGFPQGSWDKKQNREGFDLLVKGDLERAERETWAYLQMRPGNPESYLALAVISAIQGEEDSVETYLAKALNQGMPIERFHVGPRDVFQPLLASPSFAKFMSGRPVPSPLLQGPMLGQLSETSAAVWVRSLHPSRVVLRYECAGRENTVASRTLPEDDFTTVLKLEGLIPGRRVQYRIWIDDVAVPGTWDFYTPSWEAGNEGRLRVAFGGGAAYEPALEGIWDVIGSWTPNLFLFLGDNVYIDHPESPATQRYCYYRRQSNSAYRQFAAKTAIYSIWDDHDFTTDDGWGGPEVDAPAWKRSVWNVFKQNWNNPAYGLGESQPGCFYRFSLGSIDFFMLDGRYYRENPKNEDPSMLGQAQLRWLLNALKDSKGIFKMIASPVPWSEGTKPGSLDTWDGYPKERETIFRFIESQGIEGIVLLSADRHRSDHWRVDRPGCYPLHEFESSRLTNIHRHGRMPKALFSYSEGCSFGVLDFEMAGDRSSLAYRVVDHRGSEIYHYELESRELRF